MTAAASATTWCHLRAARAWLVQDPSADDIVFRAVPGPEPPDVAAEGSPLWLIGLMMSLLALAVAGYLARRWRRRSASLGADPWHALAELLATEPPADAAQFADLAVQRLRRALDTSLGCETGSLTSPQLLGLLQRRADLPASLLDCVARTLDHLDRVRFAQARLTRDDYLQCRDCLFELCQRLGSRGVPSPR